MGPVLLCFCFSHSEGEQLVAKVDDMRCKLRFIKLHKRRATGLSLKCSNLNLNLNLSLTLRKARPGSHRGKTDARRGGKARSGAAVGVHVGVRKGVRPRGRKHIISLMSVRRI